MFPVKLKDCSAGIAKKLLSVDAEIRGLLMLFTIRKYPLTICMPHVSFDYHCLALMLRAALITAGTGGHRIISGWLTGYVDSSKYGASNLS